MSKKITFSRINVSYKYLLEYQEHKINGRVVRLKSYDEKSCDVHEHILRVILSFGDYIDRELENRINAAEKSQMKINDFISKLNEPVIIEFKSFNVAIIKVRFVRQINYDYITRLIFKVDIFFGKLHIF